MTEILRIKMKWDGFNGGPGYTNFHMRDFSEGDVDPAWAQPAVDRVQAFANAIKGLLVNGAKLQVSGDVEVITAEDGKLADVLTATQPAAVNSTGPQFVTYSAPSGAVITWRTNGIRNNRRVRGRTFIVPLHGNTYQTDGTISSDTITALNTAATGLLASGITPRMGVFQRPSAPGATDGSWSFATSFSIPDMAAILRSRRD